MQPDVGESLGSVACVEDRPSSWNSSSATGNATSTFCAHESSTPEFAHNRPSFNVTSCVATALEMSSASPPKPWERAGATGRNGTCFAELDHHADTRQPTPQYPHLLRRHFQVRPRPLMPPLQACPILLPYHPDRTPSTQ